MINSDKLSTMMGAPPDMWKEIEIHQMNEIHKCYKVAYGAGIEGRKVQVQSADETENQPFVTSGGYKLMVKGEERSRPGYLRDDEDSKAQARLQGIVSSTEGFLAKCSVLRTRHGGMKEPANAPFRDHETFHESCDFDYWASYFDNTTGDSFLVETSRGIVAKICQLQSRNQVRSKKGHVPFRKQREHFVPLSLCLHEIKMWCITFLRETNPNDAVAFQEINKRIAYVDGLSQKRVWGESANTFGQGMRSVAHENLRRLMATIRHLLANAEEYCYRRYSHRSLREKLLCIYETLKECVLNEARVLSSRFEFEGQLSSPKTLALQPLDLLSMAECAHYVSFKNLVNVLLYKVFQLKLVRCALNDNFESFEESELQETLKTWKTSNLFCRQIGNEVFHIMDKKRHTKILPRIYISAAAEVKAALRKVDTRIPVPDVGKKVIKIAQNALNDKTAVEQMFKDVMSCLAALQDIFPLFYAFSELIKVSKDSGNGDMFEALENEIQQVMMDAVDRLTLMRKASKKLKRTIQERVEIKERKLLNEMNGHDQRHRFPNFLSNHRFIAMNLAKSTSESYDKCFKQFVDIAKDAKGYNENNPRDVVDVKIQRLRGAIDLVLNAPDEADNMYLPGGDTIDRSNSMAGRSKASSRNGDEGSEEGVGNNQEIIREEKPNKTKSRKKKRWFG